MANMLFVRFQSLPGCPCSEADLKAAAEFAQGLGMKRLQLLSGVEQFSYPPGKTGNWYDESKRDCEVKLREFCAVRRIGMQKVQSESNIVRIYGGIQSHESSLWLSPVVLQDGRIYLARPDMQLFREADKETVFRDPGYRAFTYPEYADAGLNRRALTRLEECRVLLSPDDTLELLQVPYIPAYWRRQRAQHEGELEHALSARDQPRVKKLIRWWTEGGYRSPDVEALATVVTALVRMEDLPPGALKIVGEAYPNIYQMLT